MIKIKLNEFIEKLEEERERSGEDNPYIYVGSQDKSGTTSIGNYHIKSEASMGDRLVYDVYTIKSLNKR